MKRKGKVGALCPWFGSNRSLAENVGRALDGCNWVGVPFAGGMSELIHITAPTVVVSDLHRHIINLANVLRDNELGPRLIRELRRLPFHEDVLRFAQEQCVSEAEPVKGDIWERLWNYRDAFNYFVTAWMGRNGRAGARGEFSSGLSVRWDGTGGDSAGRFRSAVESLRAWRKIMPRCTFLCIDVFDFLDRVQDEQGQGLYLDPPFPGPGGAYRHTFGEDTHRKLAARLATFTRCRVICRFYRHPLVEQLYPASLWEWNDLAGGKTQTNAAAPEVLLTRKAG